MKKISRWFYPIALIWIFIFSIFGMIEAGSGAPSLEKMLSWESLVVIGVPIVATIIFYWLFNKIKWWIVLIASLILGGVMTIEVILQYQSGKITDLTGEIIFTIIIWPILIIVPYFLTKLADKSRIWKMIILSLLVVFLVVQIIRTFLLEDKLGQGAEEYSEGTSKTEGFFSQDIYPKTSDAPVLELEWDGKLDPTTVPRYTPYGVWEGQFEYDEGIAYEPANEMQFYALTDVENLLAVAAGIVTQNDTYEGEAGTMTVQYGENYAITYLHTIPDQSLKVGTKIEVGNTLGQMEKRENPTWGEETWWEIQVTKKVDKHTFRTMPPYDYFSPESKELLNAISANSKETHPNNISSEDSHGWTIVDGCSWIKYTGISWWNSNRFGGFGFGDEKETDFIDSLNLGWKVGDEYGRIIGPTDICN